MTTSIPYISHIIEDVVGAKDLMGNIHIQKYSFLDHLQAWGEPRPNFNIMVIESGTLTWIEEITTNLFEFYPFEKGIEENFVKYEHIVVKFRDWLNPV